MLEKLFHGNAIVRILEQLIFEGERSFYINEMARITGFEPIHVKKELDSLLSLGIVVKVKRGNLSLYSINKISPIYSEIRSIFLKTEGIARIIRTKMSDIGKIEYMLIFGSFARGQENEKSDVDIIIIGKLNRDRLNERLNQFENETGRAVNCIAWSEEELNEKIKKNITLIREIQKEKIIMLEGDETGFRKLIGKRTN